jgi:hypothetical protein
MAKENCIYEWDVLILGGKKIVVTTNDDNYKEAIAKAQKISDDITDKNGVQRMFAIFPAYGQFRRKKTI